MIVILLVDDEKTVLDSLSAQLGRLFGDRAVCETAESAAEAWEVLDELEDDEVDIIAVVSDWLMPGERGDAFLERLRERDPAIGRILLTGHADADVLKRARETGIVHDVLYKPWQADQLRAAIVARVR